MRSTRSLPPTPYRRCTAFGARFAAPGVPSDAYGITGCTPAGCNRFPLYMPLLDRAQEGDRQGVVRVPGLPADGLQRKCLAIQAARAGASGEGARELPLLAASCQGEDWRPVQPPPVSGSSAAHARAACLRGYPSPGHLPLSYQAATASLGVSETTA